MHLVDGSGIRHIPVDIDEHNIYIRGGPLLVIYGTMDYSPYKWPNLNGYLGFYPLEVEL